jgi:23S rRNA (adenine2030-N6)-methyltransferase
MLSYRHGFHAGNFADVHKHVVLMLVLRHLLQKDTAIAFLDTHAGGGLYDLSSRFALRNREFDNGIGRLRVCRDAPAPVADYMHIIDSANPGAADREWRFCPGSPYIAARLLRPRDRLILVELHGSEVPELKRQFRSDRRVSIHHRDGYEALAALVPPRERRGVVLVDPSYELRDEFEKAAAALADAWRKWRNGIYLLWYPLGRRHPLREFHRALCRSGIRNVLMNELAVLPDGAPDRLCGSGIIIVNPPWRLDAELAELMPWLESTLGNGEHPPAKVRWLVPE